MRKTTVVVAVGMVAGVALLSVLARHHPLPFPLVPTAAVAQAGTTPRILIKQVRDDAHDPNQDWQHYELTIPPTSPPMDLHILVFTDNKGADYQAASPTPWSQPIPIKFQINTDDDQRVKTILEAQGLPVKKRLVTYHLAVGTVGGSVGWEQTLTFAHEAGGVGGGSTTQGNATAAIGERVILYDMIVPDSEFHGDLSGNVSLWPDDKPFPHLRPGQAHRFTVCVQMTPHHGPKPPCFRTALRRASR